jgi:hypothetical protein
MAPVVTSEGRKPLTTSQTPSDSSQKKIGARAINDHRETSSLTPKTVPILAERSRGLR